MEGGRKENEKERTEKRRKKRREEKSEPTVKSPGPCIFLVTSTTYFQ
jgi:hypothetical protein